MVIEIADQRTKKKPFKRQKEVIPELNTTLYYTLLPVLRPLMRQFRVDTSTTHLRGVVRAGPPTSRLWVWETIQFTGEALCCGFL